tara:strand:+ start:2926 stop:3147 length:222 start_codon:yes stop_codon:yes gene_type:complete
MYTAIISIFVIFLLYELNKKKQLIKMKDKLESMEKIDNYLNNIIEKKYKNTRLKNCPISENIIKIENELYKLR